jgi:ABC-type transport system involved in multi-copper enzyme maturation permease subunit
MSRIFAVSKYIFRQSFRNRIMNVLIIFAVFAALFSLAVSELAQEAEVKMVVDFSLFAIELFAFLTVVLSMTIQIFEETELKTLMVVMVKPIKRSEYMLGKYIGVILTVLMNMAIMTAVMMIIIRLKGGDPWDIKILAAVSFSYLSMCVLSAVALLLSTVSTTVPSWVIYITLVYALGHLTVHLKNLVDSSAGEAVRGIVDFIYYVVPNLELFNLNDKINAATGLLTPGYMLLVTGYAALYITVSLIAACFIFDEKEF